MRVRHRFDSSLTRTTTGSYVTSVPKEMLRLLGLTPLLGFDPDVELVWSVWDDRPPTVTVRFPKKKVVG